MIIELADRLGSLDSLTFVPCANDVGAYVIVAYCGELSYFKEAMAIQDSKQWYKATLLEMESL